MLSFGHIFLLVGCCAFVAISVAQELKGPALVIEPVGTGLVYLPADGGSTILAGEPGLQLGFSGSANWVFGQAVFLDLKRYHYTRFTNSHGSYMLDFQYVTFETFAQFYLHTESKWSPTFRGGLAMGHALVKDADKLQLLPARDFCNEPNYRITLGAGLRSSMSNNQGITILPFVRYFALQHAPSASSCSNDSRLSVGVLVALHLSWLSIKFPPERQKAGD